MAVRAERGRSFTKRLFSSNYRHNSHGLARLICLNLSPRSIEEQGTKLYSQILAYRDKGIQKWSRKFRDMLVLVFNIFPRPFSANDVVELIGKVENALRSKSKSAAVH